MIFATPETEFYYSDLVRKSRRDWFLALMFLPPARREALLAIYALDIELEHIHHMVKEEMIGHIRYAWWRENVEKLGITDAIRDQPVLKALAELNISKELLLPLVEAYSGAFPEFPHEASEITQKIATEYTGTYPKWEKATVAIQKHRAKYGGKKNNWLLVKLLFV